MKNIIITFLFSIFSFAAIGQSDCQIDPETQVHNFCENVINCLDTGAVVATTFFQGDTSFASICVKDNLGVLSCDTIINYIDKGTADTSVVNNVNTNDSLNAIQTHTAGGVTVTTFESVIYLTSDTVGNNIIHTLVNEKGDEFEICVPNKNPDVQGQTFDSNHTFSCSEDCTNFANTDQPSIACTDGTRAEYRIVSISDPNFSVVLDPYSGWANYAYKGDCDTLVLFDIVDVVYEMVCSGKVVSTATETFRYVPPPAELEISKNILPAIAETGEVIQIELEACELGGADANTVQVTDALPTGLDPTTIAILGSPTGTTSVTGNTLTWDIGTLTAGSCEALIYSVQIDATGGWGSIVNAATVTGNDAASGNPIQPHTDIDVVQEAPELFSDLAVSKEFDKVNYGSGSSVFITIHATNFGAIPETNIEVTEVLDPCLTFVNSDGSYNSTTGIWSIPALGVNQTVTLTIEATIGSAASCATVPNSVTISGDNTDPNSANNQAVDTAYVVEPPILGLVTKTDDLATDGTASICTTGSTCAGDDIQNDPSVFYRVPIIVKNAKTGVVETTFSIEGNGGFPASFDWTGSTIPAADQSLIEAEFSGTWGDITLDKKDISAIIGNTITACCGFIYCTGDAANPATVTCNGVASTNLVLAEIGSVCSGVITDDPRTIQTMPNHTAADFWLLTTNDNNGNFILLTNSCGDTVTYTSPDYGGIFGDFWIDDASTATSAIVWFQQNGELRKLTMTYDASCGLWEFPATYTVEGNITTASSGGYSYSGYECSGEPYFLSYRNNTFFDGTNWTQCNEAPLYGGNAVSQNAIPIDCGTCAGGFITLTAGGGLVTMRMRCPSEPITDPCVDLCSNAKWDNYTLITPKPLGTADGAGDVAQLGVNASFVFVNGCDANGMPDIWFGDGARSGLAQISVNPNIYTQTNATLQAQNATVTTSSICNFNATGADNAPDAGFFDGTYWWIGSDNPDPSAYYKIDLNAGTCDLIYQHPATGQNILTSPECY